MWLYQGDTHLIYLIFNNVYVLKWVYIYTSLKPRLKGENTYITKTNLKLKDFQNIYFKKLKIFSGEISLNNMCSDLAVKWLSPISIKSEQVSKICSMVKRLSHLMHIGGSSPFNKKE